MEQTKTHTRTTNAIIHHSVSSESNDALIETENRLTVLPSTSVNCLPFPEPTERTKYENTKTSCRILFHCLRRRILFFFSYLIFTFIYSSSHSHFVRLFVSSLHNSLFFCFFFCYSGSRLRAPLRVICIVGRHRRI